MRKRLLRITAILLAVSLLAGMHVLAEEPLPENAAASDTDISDGGNAIPEGDSSGESSASSGGEAGNYGSPWVNSIDAGNLPDEKPEAKDNLLLHYAYDVLAIHQDGTDYNGMAATSGEISEFIISYIEDGSHDDSETQQLRILFEQSSDFEAMKEAGLSKLQPYLDMVASAASIEELNAVLTSEEFPFDPWMSLSVGAMAQDRNDHNYVFLEPVLLFADKLMEENLVDSDDPTVQQVRQSLLMQKILPVIDILTALGVTGEDANAAAGAMLEIDKSYGTHLNTNDPKYQEYGAYAVSMSNYSFEELAQISPSFPLSGIIARFGKETAQGYSVQYPEWIEALNNQWTEENLELLKQMTQCKIVMECRYMLDPDLFQVSRTSVMLPAPEPEENAYKACDSVNAFSQLIARIYVEECLGTETVERLTGMTEQLIEVYKQLVEETGWLGEASRQNVLDKLDNMKLNILYPEGGYFSYEELALTPTQEGGDIISNYLKLKEYNNAKEAALLKQPALCCTTWQSMSPVMANAFYAEFDNSINIFPGIITSNVYHSEMSDEEMLGGIGYCIGHEISHGFDFKGSQMDQYGRAGSIFTAEDIDHFLKICDDLAAYYDTMEFMPGMYVDGKRVNVEAAADLSGMQAILTYAESCPGFQYERLFEQASRAFASTSAAGMSYIYTVIDNHPLSYLRVNINAQMFDAIYDVYGVQEGDGMYLASESRIRFWGAE